MNSLAPTHMLFFLGTLVIAGAAFDWYWLSLAAGIGIWVYAVSTRKPHSQTQPPSSSAAAFDTLEKSAFLMQNLAAAVILRDRSDKILYCSPFTEVLTGYSIQEIQSREEDFFISVMHEDDKEKYQRALHICHAGEPFQSRFRLTHRSGIEIWAETRTVPILDEQGSYTASLAVLLDVTGSVRYQKQVEEKNRDLQDFTYMVSHDLKAPISTIKGMLQVLNEDHLSQINAEGREVVDHVGRAAERLHQLVSRVLEFARLSAGEVKSERVSLHDILVEVEKDYTPQIKECGATLHYPSDLPKVTADHVHLYRIFANLIGNALKYRSAERQPKIEISVSQTRRSVSVAIKDNGIGLPAEELPKLFRPFHRAHSGNVEGTGIGLASVHRLLEKMGGNIKVESDLNVGSTFTVQLRRSAD
jgi:PAS domain S-box-containing protein